MHQLFDAVKSGSFSTLRLLETELKNDFRSQLCSLDGSGMSVLHYAAEQGYTEIIEWLLDDNRVPVDLKDCRGGSALLEAAASGSLEAVKLLVSKGLDVNEADGRGDTSMHVAAAGGHVKVMAFLYENGAEVDARTTLGVTPILYATLKSQLSAIRWLAKKGASLTVQEEGQGWQPVHIAAGNNLVPILKWIAEQDSSLILAKSREGKIPKEVARLEGCPETYQCCIALEKIHAKKLKREQRDKERRERAEKEAAIAKEAADEAERIALELFKDDVKRKSKLKKKSVCVDKTNVVTTATSKEKECESKNETTLSPVSFKDTLVSDSPNLVNGASHSSTTSGRQEEGNHWQDVGRDGTIETNQVENVPTNENLVNGASHTSTTSRRQGEDNDWQDVAQDGTVETNQVENVPTNENEWLTSVSRRTRREQRKQQRKTQDRATANSKRIRSQRKQTQRNSKKVPPSILSTQGSTSSTHSNEDKKSMSTPSGTSIDASQMNHVSRPQNRWGMSASVVDAVNTASATSRLRPLAPPWSPKARRWVAWNNSASNDIATAVAQNSIATRSSSSAIAELSNHPGLRESPVDSPERAESEFHRMLKKFVHMDAGARRAARQRFAKAALEHEMSRRAKAHAIERNWRKSVKARLNRAIDSEDVIGLRDVLDEVHATQEARTLHEEFNQGLGELEVKERENVQSKVQNARINVKSRRRYKKSQSDAEKQKLIVSTIKNEEESALFEIEKDAELQQCISLAERQLQLLSTPKLGQFHATLVPDEDKLGRCAVMDLCQNLEENNELNLERDLTQSVRAWMLKDVESMLLKIPTGCGTLVPIATTLGFDFHKATSGILTMVYRVPKIATSCAKTSAPPPTEDCSLSTAAVKTHAGSHAGASNSTVDSTRKAKGDGESSTSSSSDDDYSHGTTSEVSALVVRVRQRNSDKTKTDDIPHSHFEILVKKRDDSAAWGIPSKIVHRSETVDRAMNKLVKNLQWLSTTEQAHSPICVSHSKWSPGSKMKGSNGRELRNHFVCVLFASGVHADLDFVKDGLQRETQYNWVELESISSRSDMCDITKLSCSLLLTDSSATDSRTSEENMHSYLKPQRLAYERSAATAVGPRSFHDGEASVSGRTRPHTSKQQGNGNFAPPAV